MTTREKKYLNTGKRIKLRSLIISGDIDDNTKIAIYTNDGKYICRGNWYEDKVLEHGEFFGLATKSGTGTSIQFRLA